MKLDEAIAHAKEVASKKYAEGMLCHANPNDEELNACIECAEEHEQLAGWLKELKKYKSLEEQGLLIKLPCKVGDTVYYISEGLIEPCTVEVIFLAYYTDKDGNNSYMAEIHYDREDCPYVSTEIYFTEIGKTVFLTRNEAEEALQKMNEMEG